MKNILHAIDTTGPGGAETVFMALASGTDPKQYRSHVAVSARGWLYDELCKRGFDPFVVGGQKGFDFGYLWRLVRIVRTKNIDVIQSHLFGSNVYCSMAGFLCRVPVICTFHGGVDVSSSDKLANIKFRIINWCASKVVFVSDHLARHFEKQSCISKRKTVRIYNGVDTEAYRFHRDDSLRKQHGIEPDQMVIGAVGNIRPAKSYDVLLRAAALLRSASVRFKVIISGLGDTGLYKELLELRKQLGLDDQVLFVGFQKNIPMVLNNFDVYVLSSSSEGFPLALLEAMSCRLPVVVTRSGGPEEVVMDGQNGLLVEIGQPAQLADAMLRLVGNDELRNRLSVQARTDVLTKFSFQAMIREYEKIYAQAIRQSH